MHFILNDIDIVQGFGDFRIGRRVDGINMEELAVVGQPDGGVIAYGFQWMNVAVEMTTKDGIVNSFDIMMTHQQQDILLRGGSGRLFSLNAGKLDDLLLFLNQAGIEWKFKPFFRDRMGKLLIVEMLLNLQISLHYDFSQAELERSLVLINIGARQ